MTLDSGDSDLDAERVRNARLARRLEDLTLDASSVLDRVAGLEDGLLANRSQTDQIIGYLVQAFERLDGVAATVDQLRGETNLAMRRLEEVATRMDIVAAAAPATDKIRRLIDEQEAVLSGMRSALSSTDHRVDQLRKGLVDMEESLDVIDDDLQDEPVRQPLLQLDDIDKITKAPMPESAESLRVSKVIGEAGHAHRVPPASSRPPVVANYNLKRRRLRRRPH